MQEPVARDVLTSDMVSTTSLSFLLSVVDHVTWGSYLKAQNVTKPSGACKSCVIDIFISLRNCVRLSGDTVVSAITTAQNSTANF